MYINNFEKSLNSNMTEIAKHVVHVITTETISESLSIKTEQVTAVI